MISIDAEKNVIFFVNVQQPGNRKGLFNLIKVIVRNRGRGLEKASFIVVKY